MDAYTDLRFHFRGRVPETSDDPEPSSDRSLLGLLSEERAAITREVRAYLREEIADELGIDAEVFVEIDFHEGSVLFAGFVTLIGVLADIAGAIDFAQKVVRLIRQALRWALGRRADGRRVRVNAYPAFPVPATTVATAAVPTEGLLFSLRTILLAVTLLNASLFIGGSVYTGISVTSIQEKYEKAQGEIEKVRQDYEKYRAGLQDRLGDIEGQLRTTAKETDEADRHARQLSQDLASLDGHVQELRASIATVRDKGASWISLRLAFRQANWILKLYLIVVPLNVLATFLLGLRAVMR